MLNRIVAGEDVGPEDAEPMSECTYCRLIGLAFRNCHQENGECVVVDEKTCHDCRRVLSAMSVEPPPDAQGLAFPDCRLAPCWHELQRERVVGELDTDVPF